MAGEAAKKGGFLWRLCLVISLPLALVLGVLLWMSGANETHGAFDSGRRLVIRLDNGAIQGREVRVEGPGAKAVPLDMKEDKSLADKSQVTPSENAAANANPELVERTAEGSVPKIGSDGTKPWKFYAKPYESKSSVPMIAIIITGLGQNKNATDAATRLPENVTLSFSPYAKSSPTWANAARAAGHEIMLDLPLQPSNYPVTDPGPKGLLSGHADEENEQKLRWVMSRIQCYTGFTLPQNEGYSTDAPAFKTLLQDMADRGLMVVVGKEPAKTETKDLIKDGKAASIVADMLIDEDLSSTGIQTRLASLQQVARSKGYAVGIAQPLPITLKELGTWAAKLSDQGFVLVPLTAITKQRYS